MKEKDKYLLKKVPLAIIEGIVAAIPGLAVAWELRKTLLGSSVELKTERLLEWVEMIKDNPKIFTEQLMKQEEFIDGFVYSLKEYLIQRNEEKRKYFRNIFLGFAQTEDKQNFPLEKFIHTLEQLTEVDIKVLKDAEKQESKYHSNEFYEIYTEPDELKKYIDNIYYLISLGLLLHTYRVYYGGLSEPVVRLSEFGKEFIKYIKECII